MLRYVILPGLLCYGNETVEDAAARQDRMLAHNRALDRLLARNGRPMPAMRAWARRRGIRQSLDVVR